MFLLACGSLRLIGVSHFLYIYRPPTSLLSLSYPIALPCPFRSLPLRPTLMLRAGPDPPLAPFTSLRSHGFASPRYCRARYSSLCRQPTLMLRVDLPPLFAPLAPQRSPRLPPPFYHRCELASAPHPFHSALSRQALSTNGQGISNILPALAAKFASHFAARPPSPKPLTFYRSIPLLSSLHQAYTFPVAI